MTASGYHVVRVEKDDDGFIIGAEPITVVLASAMLAHLNMELHIKLLDPLHEDDYLVLPVGAQAVIDAEICRRELAAKYDVNTDAEPAYEVGDDDIEF